MAKQLNINLGFTADTKAASSQIQSLQQQLTTLVNQPTGIGTKLTKEIVEASHAAAELKVHLQNATNVNTGILDFGKLTNSIKQSGMSLSEYGAKLQSLGPQGQQAFMSLANAVASAEVPLRHSSALLTNFLTTLKNTAKWQISSSLLHGLTGGIQEAYGYAKDLNESLNNIRIVTGLNVEEMSRFAKEANAAAKALSTTTTEYTNASLIYYQQGLNAQEVKERTELTIKMANVARVSAETASDQLTAIWNNFDNGTKSLEYYVDVMTALGAKTASSTDEIAGGLEKFAAIADTIGLSYEYATAALTTLTSNTRQSEEEIGTALKTIFARMQGLRLGETLEDGVTLNQYSDALRKIGVDILDQNGDLIDMDNILDGIAEKWNILSRAQQAALAQTVAGVRQYTQLIALMDNWNKGDEDSFVANVATARGASGALQEQADIYAESWEAVRDRVTAAAEEIYSQLFDDEGFIKITNAFADMVELVGDFTQGIGGLSGVITAFGVLMTRVFSEQMAQGFRNIAYNIQMSTDAGMKAVQKQKLAMMQEFASLMANNETSGTMEKRVQEVYTQELDLQTDLIANADRMTSAEKEKYNILLEQQRTYGQQSIELARQLELAEEQRAALSVNVLGEGMLQGKSFEQVSIGLKGLRESSQAIGDAEIALKKLGQQGQQNTNIVNSLKEALILAGQTDDDLEALEESFSEIATKGLKATDAIENIRATLYSITNKQASNFLINTLGLKEGSDEYKRLLPILNKYSQSIADVTIKSHANDTANKSLKTSYQGLKDAIAQAKGVTKDWANHLSTITSSLMSAGMLISSINGLIDTLQDPNTSGWEKFGSILTSVSMAGMSLAGTLQLLNAATGLWQSLAKAENQEKIKSVILSWAEAKATKVTAENKEEAAQASVANAAAINEENKEKTESIILDTASNKGLSTGTFAKGKNQGKTWYRQNGKFISKEQFTALSNSNTSSATGSAVEAASTSWGAVLGKALPAVGPYIAAAAGVALLAVTITGVIAHYQKWNIEAEKAAEAASILKDRVDEVKTSFDEFTNLSDGYKNAKKSLDDLTKGTEEYNQALLEANSSAMELLEKYDSLAGHYTIDSDGLIQIDSTVLASAQAEQLKTVQQAQSAALLGNVVANNAAQKAKQVDMTRELNSRSDNWATVGNTYASKSIGTLAGAGIGVGIGAGLAAAGVGASAGAAAGSGVPVIGTAIGAVVGAVAGTVAGIVSTEMAGATAELETQTLNAIADKYEENPNIFIDDKTFEKFLRTKLELKDEPLIKSLVENRKAVEELTKAEQLRAIQEKSDWKAAFNAAAANNDIYTASEDKDALANLAYADVDENLRSQAADKVDALFSGSNDDFWAKYLETVYGQSGVSMSGAGVTGEDVRVRNLGGGAVTLEKKNADGVWERIGDKNGLDESVARDQLIEAEAQRMAEAAMSKYNTTIEDLTSGLVDAGLDSTKDTHEQAIHSILSQFTDKGKIDLTDYAYTLITGLDTDKIGDSNLQSAVEQAKQNYLNGLSDLKKQIFEASWYKTLTEENKEIFWTIDIDQYSTLDNVEEAWEAAQAYIEHNKLIGTIEIADKLGGLLEKERKSEDDWAAIKTEYANLAADNPGIKSWIDFMELNQQEQIKYVQAIKSGSIGKAAITSADAIAESKEGIVAAERAYQNKFDTYEYTRDVLIPQAQSAYNQAVKNNPYHDLVFEKGIGLNELFGRGGQVTLAQIEEFLLNQNSPYLDFLSSEGKNALTAFFASTRMQNAEGANDAINQLRASFKTQMAPEQVRAFEGVFANLYTGIAGTGFAGDAEGLLGFFQQEYGNVVLGSLSTHIQDLAEGLTEPTTAAIDDAKEKTVELQQNYQNALDAQEAYFAEIGLNVDDVANLATGLGMINAELEENEYLANAVAASMLRYSKGVKAVAENYDIWLEALENGNDAQRASILPDIADAYGNILNIDGSLLSTDILNDTELLGLIDDIAEGSESAYDELQVRIGQAFLGAHYTQQNIFGQDIRKGFAQVLSASWTEGDIVKITDETGENLRGLVMTAYSEALAKTGDSEEAKHIAENFLRSIGYAIAEEDINTGAIFSFVKLAEKYEEITDEVEEDQKDKQLAEIERYKAINDQLDELADAYEDVSKAADRLYGNDRLAQISKQNELLRDEIELLEQKRKKAEETYLPNDQVAVDNALSAFNLTDGNGKPLKFSYDNGIITNYRDVLQQVRQAAEGDETKSEQFQILLDAIEQYDQTRELIRDINNEIRDTNNLIQDNNYIKLTEKLNYDLEITNNELQELDYYLSKTENDFYKMAEAAGYMVGNDGKSGQRGYYEEILDRQQAQVEALKAAYAAGDISEADYVEGLKEAKDAIYEQLEALTGLDKQMLEYYGNTLAAAGEEIGKYTEKMDNLNGVLDHYSSLLKLIGKEKNYDMMAEVLQGSVDVLSDSLDVATKEYEFYSTEAQNKEKAYNDAVDAGADQSVLDLLKKEWDAAEQAQADAQDRMLAKTEQWAEAQKAVIENAMEKAAAALEDALVGKHYSFDFLNEQIDQAVSTQEEYLTTTNKIYETTKLMRTAQQAIDASTNSTTKQKLKNFVTETKQLQDQTDLSKYELEIQQAKYDLLLAEIALQDAQNAKSMVRLKRDSEGNFGYVYTADDNQVADAQQNLEDAENNLYNIALRGAEDYTTKQIELKQEMQEKLKELTAQFRNGEIQDEKEYNERIASMQEYYTEKMESNARLYNVAIDTDNRVIADSWSTTFADLTTDTSQWTTSVTKYLQESATQLEKWQDVMAAVEKAVTGDCKNLADSVSKVTEASEDLRNTLLGAEGKDGIFDEIKSQVNKVSAITKAYAEQRDTIQDLILTYETYAKTVKGDITTAITDGENPPPTNGGENTNTHTPELKKGAKATLSSKATTWASGANIASYAKGATFEILAIDGDRVLLGNPSYNPEGGVTGWIKKVDLAGFASGGYTGEWGPEGKLAMLHQKELVLNQQDTSNLLAAVEMLRVILETLDIHSLSAQVGGFLSSPGYYNNNSNTLEQEVKIEASFPGVTDRYEIEEAFNNLINRASQYANRK